MYIYVYAWISLDLLSFWNGVYDDFQNQWLNLKKKINFQNDRKISQPIKNQTIYCNLGLMRQTDQKQTEI